jgi:uncharacterized protein (DUF1778 family)
MHLASILVGQGHQNEAEAMARTTGMQLRKQLVEQELMRLAAAIAESGHSRFVLDAMAERERELDQLAQRLQMLKQGNVELHPGSIRGFVKTRLSDLLGLLNTDTARAPAELARQTTEIRMIPEKGTDSFST